MDHKSPEYTQKVHELGLDQDVNFQEQDSDALLKIYQEKKKLLWDALGSKEIQSIHHVGSSAIRGMPGPPCVDMIMFVHTWPPTDVVLEAVNNLKFNARGDAPHYSGDKWFWFTPEGKTVQDIGSVVLHEVNKDNPDAVAKQILWAEYCNNNKEAFEAYKAIKLEACESGKFHLYKMKKSEMVQKWFPKAQEWKKQQMEKKSE